MKVGGIHFVRGSLTWRTIVLAVTVIASIAAVAGGFPLLASETSPVETENEPQAAKRQVERVMNAGLPFAEKMLAERGEFLPFGAVMLGTGLIQTVNAPEAETDAPVDTVYRKLLEGLSEGAGDGTYMAVGTFAMVEMLNPADGETLTVVHVGLEHRDGYCVDVYYPTLLRGNGLELGDSFAGKRSGTFYDSCQ